jgi:microcystin-dependent protein
MQATSQERYNKKTYGSLRLYNTSSSKWVPIRGNEIGDIKYSVKSSDHLGWLICDGRSLSRETYTELFNIIGTTYGSNSATTFNLPDCRGRVLGGSGSGSGLTSRSSGTLLGSETHTMTTNEMPTHTHTGTTSSNGSHTHTHNANGGQGGLGLVTANGFNTETDVDTSAGELNLWTTPAALSINSNGDHTHTFTTNSTGNSQPFNIMQPTAFIGYVFIFANHTDQEF